MSKSKNQANLGGLLAESVSVRQRRGKLIITNQAKAKPKKVKATPKLIAQRGRFKEASQYAQRQYQDEASKALYRKGIKGKHESVYTAAMRDFITAPRVDTINPDDYRGAIGDLLEIDAVDDFMVTKVKVVISDSAGAVIEQGEAREHPMRPNRWQYTAVVANPARTGTRITATAFDRPGNMGTAEIVL